MTVRINSFVIGSTDVVRRTKPIVADSLDAFCDSMTALLYRILDDGVFELGWYDRAKQVWVYGQGTYVDITDKPNRRWIVLRNMWKESVRLWTYMFGWDRIKNEWYTSKQEFNYVEFRNGKVIRTDVKQDAFDRVVWVIRDILHVFRRNILVHTPCTHPHEKVYVYDCQICCGECGGYLNREDVDRYRAHQHPELIDTTC